MYFYVYISVQKRKPCGHMHMGIRTICFPMEMRREHQIHGIPLGNKYTFHCHVHSNTGHVLRQMLHNTNVIECNNTYLQVHPTEK